MNLGKAGYGVSIAATGTDALEAVRRLRPAAVLLDVGLPDMDGVEVCRRLRAAEDWTPVLFVTARDDEVDRDRRPGARRRRLRHQTVQPAGAGRPRDERAAPLPRPPGQRRARGRRGPARPRPAAGVGRRAGGRPDRHRVRPARLPHAPPRPGGVPRAAAQRGVGLQPGRRHPHRRRPRRAAAGQARRRQPGPHGARRRLLRRRRRRDSRRRAAGAGAAAWRCGSRCSPRWSRSSPPWSPASWRSA